MFDGGSAERAAERCVKYRAAVHVKSCGECPGGGCGVVCDGGLTPIEIIIGVVLLAILSGVVVFQAFRFIAKADDSAARRSLEAAVTVVGIMGQLDASGGGESGGRPEPEHSGCDHKAERTTIRSRTNNV